FLIVALKPLDQTQTTIGWSTLPIEFQRLVELDTSIIVFLTSHRDLTQSDVRRGVPLVEFQHALKITSCIFDFFLGQVNATACIEGNHVRLFSTQDLTQILDGTVIFFLSDGEGGPVEISLNTLRLGIRPTAQRGKGFQILLGLEIVPAALQVS